MARNRQPELFAAAIIPYTAALAALVLRMVARKKTSMPYVWEDYLAVVAFIIGSAFTFLSIAKTRWGLGKHLVDVHSMSKDLIAYHFYLDLFVDMWLYTFSVGLSKFVILGLYWRIFSSSIIRQPIRILFACSAGWILARIILILFQCQPIRKFWHRDIDGRCVLTPMITLFGAGIPHFVLEVAILLCPLIEIRRLHLPTRKKLAVALMFMSGVLTCGSALGSIIHTITLAKNTENRDLTWDALDDQIWAVCDVNIASFATSLPLLRPVFQSFIDVIKSATTASPIHGDSLRLRAYGNVASKRGRTQHDAETDSVIGFAGDEGYTLSSDRASAHKLYALQDILLRESNEDVESDASMQREASINIGKAL